MAGHVTLVGESAELGETGVTDLLFAPDNPDVLYAAAYERRRHIWSFMAGGPNGEHRVTPVRSQDSSLLAPLAGADCLIVRAPNAPAAVAGEAVEILPLDF